MHVRKPGASPACMAVGVMHWRYDESRCVKHVCEGTRLQHILMVELAEHEHRTVVLVFRVHWRCVQVRLGTAGAAAYWY